MYVPEYSFLTRITVYLENCGNSLKGYRTHGKTCIKIVDT